jgi:hypothetical protein
MREKRASAMRRVPTVRAQAARLADIAAPALHTHLGYLAEVLAAELDDRSGRPGPRCR